MLHRSLNPTWISTTLSSWPGPCSTCLTPLLLSCPGPAAIIPGTQVKLWEYDVASWMAFWTGRSVNSCHCAIGIGNLNDWTPEVDNVNFTLSSKNALIKNWVEVPVSLGLMEGFALGRRRTSIDVCERELGQSVLSGQIPMLHLWYERLTKMKPHCCSSTWNTMCVLFTAW